MIRYLSRNMKHALLCAVSLMLVIGGGLFSSAKAYDYSDQKTSGNLTTFSNITLEQGANAPAIKVGTLEVTGLSEGAKPGFVVADDIRLKNLEVEHTFKGMTFTLTVPELHVENYDGPSFSEAQMSDHDFTHPVFNWVLLALQAFGDRHVYDQGFTMRVAQGGHLKFEMRLGRYEALSKNNEFSESFESANVRFRSLDLGTEFDFSFELGAFQSTGQGDYKSWLMSFIYPEDYPDQPELLFDNITTERIESASRVGPEFEEKQVMTGMRYTNLSYPTLSQSERLMLAKLVRLLARNGRLKTDEERMAFFALLDKDALLGVVDSILNYSMEESVVEQLEITQKLNVDSEYITDVVTQFGTMKTTGHKGLNAERYSMENIRYNITHNGQVLTDIKVADVSLEGLQLNHVIRNVSRYLIEGLVNGPDLDETMPQALMNMALNLTLNDVYPRLGNLSVSDIKFAATIDNENINVSVDDLHTTQADNEGMPDFGSLMVKNLVTSAATLVAHVGPAASFVADEDGNIGLSLALNWRADEANGAYVLESFKTTLKDGLEVDFSAHFGGLMPNWQSEPLMVVFQPSLEETLGLKSVSLSLKDLGIYQRLLDFVPVMTGMSVDEAKIMAKGGLKQLLSVIGGDAYTLLLSRALDTFIDEGGYINVMLKPKDRDVLPFSEMEQVLTENMGQIDQIVDYEVTNKP